MNRIILATIFLLASTFSYATPMLTVTATGNGGNDNDGYHLVHFTVDYAAGYPNNKPYLDTLSIDLVGQSAVTDDDFAGYTFDFFNENVGNPGYVVGSTGVTGLGTSMLTLDFLDKKFDSGEIFGFYVGIHAACTNEAGEKCRDFGIEKNSGAVLGHLGSTLSATFVTHGTGVSETYGATFMTTSKSSPSTSVASVPEPGSIALLAAGLFGLGFSRRKARS